MYGIGRTKLESNNQPPVGGVGTNQQPNVGLSQSKAWGGLPGKCLATPTGMPGTRKPPPTNVRARHPVYRQTFTQQCTINATPPPRPACRPAPPVRTGEVPVCLVFPPGKGGVRMSGARRANWRESPEGGMANGSVGVFHPAPGRPGPRMSPVQRTIMH